MADRVFQLAILYLQWLHFWNNSNLMIEAVALLYMVLQRLLPDKGWSLPYNFTAGMLTYEDFSIKT